MIHKKNRILLNYYCKVNIDNHDSFLFISMYMKFSQCHHKIKKILDVDLPSGSSVSGKMHKLTGDIKIGRSNRKRN